MRITKTFCDLCEKECDQVRFGVVSGCIVKMDITGQMNKMIFEGHYCEDDIGKIIGFIEGSKVIVIKEQPDEGGIKQPTI